MREFLIWAADMAFQTAYALVYVLPLVCVVGIAIHVWPRRFGALGSSASRKGLAIVMTAVWLLAIVGIFLLFYVSRSYSREHGFVLVAFLAYMAPSLVLSLIGLVVRYKTRVRGEEDA
ncbi:hypothetical protein ACVCNH_27885 [Achromobacter anxifer]